jgi:hypothetical protein
MVPLWWATTVVISACEFDCNSNLCGDNSNVTLVNYTFYYWTHDSSGLGVKQPTTVLTIDLRGRGITSIAVGGFNCANWPGGAFGELIIPC